MRIENHTAYLTQEEYDALPHEQTEYKKGVMWLEESRLTPMYEAKGLKSIIYSCIFWKARKLLVERMGVIAMWAT
jgi:hypothetical protein